LDVLDKILGEINEIELKTNLTESSILGEKIWPLIRLRIIDEKVEKVFTSQKRISLFSNVFAVIKSFLSFFKIFKSNKIIFFSHGVDKSALYNFKNQLIHKQWTPLIDKFGRKNFLIIQFGSVGSTQNHLKSTWNINFLFFIYSLFKIFEKNHNFLLNKELKKILQPYKTKEVSDEIYQDVNKFFKQRSFFLCLLKILKPKAIFFKGFNDINSFSIISAANLLGINTVDYQHGQQGENSLSYSNWVNIPKEGYKMLPKFFWIWEETFKGKFEKWMNNQTFHEVFVGGNLWTEFIKNKIDFEQKKLFSSKKKHVLVCLQKTHLPQVILKAMGLTDNIIWHFKLHPRDKNNTSKIISELENANILEDKFELKVTNNLLFEELINSVDVVISEWSTVTYEAVLYGKKGIVIHENGKVAYKKYIDKKVISYTERADQLVKLILDYRPIEYVPESNINKTKVSQILSL
jgi:hypothetical protein